MYLIVSQVAPSLIMKPSDKSWLVQGGEGILFAVLLLVMVWLGLYLLRTYMKSSRRSFFRQNSGSRNGIELLSRLHLSPKLQAYQIKMDQKVFLVVDNAQSLSVTLLGIESIDEESIEKEYLSSRDGK